MQIDAARLDDARGIAEVHVRTWQTAYPGIVPREYLDSLSIDKHETMWREAIVGGKPELLVARDDNGGVAGWVAFGASRDKDATESAAEIWAIYVSATAWGSGVGRALWKHARVRMRDHGFTSVTLWVFPENVRAARFYESIGFALMPGSAKQFMLGGSTLNEVRYRRAIDSDSDAES